MSLLIVGRRGELMRYLIWYIRSLFCKHEWKHEECIWKTKNTYGYTNEGRTVSATCKICGWHRSYEKY